MIQDEIVTHEVAKLVKEKGFPQDVFGTCEMKSACYLEDGRFYKDGCIYPIENAYTAPTQSLLQRWLREERGIYIEVYIDWEDSIDYNMIKYSWRVSTTYKVGDKKIGGRIRNESELYFDTYELALEDALAYSLKNLV